MFKNKAEQNRNDEKNNQTVKIHSYHDSVRATAIMPRPIAASSSCDLWSSQ